MDFDDRDPESPTIRPLHRVLIALAALALLAAASPWVLLRGSLAQIDGERALTGLEAPVTVTWDARGVPTLRGRTRTDVARATGHRTLYAPNLIGTPARVLEQLRIAQELGARAVMVSPLLLGLPFFFDSANSLSTASMSGFLLPVYSNGKSLPGPMCVLPLSITR